MAKWQIAINTKGQSRWPSRGGNRGRTEAAVTVDGKAGSIQINATRMLRRFNMFRTVLELVLCAHVKGEKAFELARGQVVQELLPHALFALLTSY
jgi:hypothetical protein